MIGVNVSPENVGLVPLALPVLATPHDDFDPSLPLARMAPYRGRKVGLVRGYSPRSNIYTDLPDGTPYTYDNEDDAGDPATGAREWRIPYARSVKLARPGLPLVCPAEKWFERDQYDPREIALCDAISVHVAVFENPLGWAFLRSYGKPIVITEVEADPASDALDLLLPAAIAHQAAGAVDVYLWGDGQTEANIVFRADILQAAMQYNTDHPVGPISFPGGLTLPIDADVQQALDDINKRIANQTEGLRRVVEGHYSGAAGAAAIVVALEGGNTTVNPQPDVPNR